MTMRQLLLRSALAGRRRSQPFFRQAHRATIRLRGYGVGSVGDSGEHHLLASLSGSVGHGVVLDVGANLGEWSLAAHEAWPHATIHAFEPSAAMFVDLSRRTAGLPVRCVNAAVSEEAGTSTLYEVPGHPGFSSLTKRDLLEHRLDMSNSQTIDVTTLDRYCAEQLIDHVDFLKIDVEGHELDVLHGAADLLRAHAIDRIQFEFGGANIDTRTYLRDFVRLLGPEFTLYRLLTDGLEPLIYSEREEIFAMANFLAISRHLEDRTRSPR